MIPVDATIRRPATFPFAGRLMAIPTTRSLQTVDLDDQLAIYFPAMPDTIELNRTAEYLVHTSIVLPDGVHQYKKTFPLEIPFSFRLHSFDQEYCPNGAYTLLQLAARLHSFILPIDTSGGNVSIMAKAGAVNGTSEGQLEAKGVQPDGGLSIIPIGAQFVFNPVTLRLDLIFTESETPGISCIGYVKDVSVKLNGPWLRGPGKSFNLPSSGDFAFTFVHRPGHGNAFNLYNQTSELDTNPQAFAAVVKEKFYNTRSLAKIGSYQGLNNPAQPAQTGAPQLQGGDSSTP